MRWDQRWRERDEDTTYMDRTREKGDFEDTREG
jgi:hypothetical protein